MTAITITRPAVTTPRWKAVITYRSRVTGSVEVEHAIEELSEIEALVEAGPDWNAISDIRITLERYHGPATLEEAEEQ